MPELFTAFDAAAVTAATIWSACRPIAQGIVQALSLRLSHTQFVTADISTISDK